MKNVRYLMSCVALLALALAGCSGCEKKHEPKNFVPTEVAALIVVPSIDTAVPQLKALKAKLEQGILSGALLSGPMDALKENLKFDIENPETIKKIGLNTASPMHFAMLPGKQLLMTAFVTNAQEADKYIREQAAKLLPGGNKFTERKADGLKFVDVQRTSDKKMVGSWTFWGTELVLVSSDSGGADTTLKQLLAQPKSIDDNAGYQALKKEYTQAALHVYFNGQGLSKTIATGDLPQSDVITKSFAEVKDALIALFPSAQGLSIQGSYTMSDAKFKQIRDFYGSADSKQASLGRFMTGQPLFAINASLPKKDLVMKQLNELKPEERGALNQVLSGMDAQLGVSVENDILPLLGGPLFASVYGLHAPKDFSRPPKAPGDVLTLLKMAIFVQVTDAAAAQRFSDKLAATIVEKKIATVATSKAGASSIVTVSHENQPVVAWSLQGTTLIVAHPDELPGAIGRVAKGAAAGDSKFVEQFASEASKKAFARPGATAIALSPARIGETLRKLEMPAEIKMLMGSVLDTLDKFKDVTISVWADETKMSADLTVTLN